MLRIFFLALMGALVVQVYEVASYRLREASASQLEHLDRRANGTGLRLNSSQQEKKHAFAYRLKHGHRSKTATSSKGEDPPKCPCSASWCWQPVNGDFDDCEFPCEKCANLSGAATTCYFYGGWAWDYRCG
eukprot:TRINITY_DN64374_c0_g1_i1.p1 TRINITY_DN64374_c0_g1~~TRINITY_DN64374_c0_g1_i1.p1  ORF type:complete len:131 (-),score=16.27 TRINITY_DN64374_c0_g1_i1:149-541(-)